MLRMMRKPSNLATESTGTATQGGSGRQSWCLSPQLREAVLSCANYYSRDRSRKSICISTLLKYCIDTEQLGTSILRHCPGLNASPQERQEKPLHSIWFISTFRLLPRYRFIATGIATSTPRL